ncbi:uncharacterized protein LOC143033538 [Oratosquilla oratoria]|uniref:uncharacterized protein LOC143033538 n=1 Tax=Oratosquilla oratoria TaxID=337810 RepID=UPI003F763A39
MGPRKTVGSTVGLGISRGPVNQLVVSKILVPEALKILHDKLVDKVYDNLEENHLNASYFEKRAIISPTNDDVDRINLMVYDKSEEPEKVYMSVDTAMEEVTDIQTSVFNAITSPSILHSALRTDNFMSPAQELQAGILSSYTQVGKK